MKRTRMSREQRRELTAKSREYRRIALLVAGLSVLVLFTVTVIAGAGVRASVGCSVCHSMEPYARAHAESVHGTIACAECHARAGLLGVVPDGLRALSWTGSALLGGTPSSSVTMGESACLRCHETITAETIVNNGIAVRHSDFIATTACSFCHGGTAHLVEGRVYRAAHMEDCTTCHTTALTDLGGCDLCHVSGSSEPRSENTTAWRVTHGTEWESTHGMGDQSTCRSCHPVDFCVKCHGVRVPHAVDWAAVHGRDLSAETKAACATCHEPAWCEDCHGIEMPHPADFLPEHGTVSDTVGETTCERCHDPRGCDVCHFESSHPNLPLTGSHGS